MALINMIAKSTGTINWDRFLKDYYSLNLFNIEVFPIPKELGFDYDNIGVTVHQGYSDKEITIKEIERFITFFKSDPYAFKFIELYDGGEVFPETLVLLINKLLST